MVIRGRLAALGRLLARVWTESLRNEILLRASALAFTTLTSLVPLLAVVSTFVARTLREDEARIMDLIAELLPYREEAVIAALRSFLAQTESVSGIALAGFLIIALVTFFGVQESLFRIFGIEQPPSIARRLVTFSLLFFWGPLLVGFAQAGLLLAGQTSDVVARLVRESALVRALPAAVTFVGLTMLFWRAAQGRIRFRHAAIGGATAMVLIELLKLVFAYYVRELTEIQRAIYGGFAIALFFVVSVQLAWTILLYGAQLAACVGLPRDEGHAERPVDPDPWVGLAVLARLASERGRPQTARELAEALQISSHRLLHDFAPLVGAGLASRRGRRDPELALALPARELRIAAALAAYRRRMDATPAPLPASVLDLRQRLLRATEHELAATTLADLLAPPPPAAVEALPPLVEPEGSG
jgi:membrane protein